MPKVDLSTKILARNGEPMKDGERDLTVRGVIFSAIDTPAEDDRQMGGETRLAWHKLGKKIAEQDEIELTADETAKILSRLDKLGFIPLVYGQVAEILDPALAAK